MCDMTDKEYTILFEPLIHLLASNTYLIRNIHDILFGAAALHSQVFKVYLQRYIHFVINKYKSSYNIHVYTEKEKERKQKWGISAACRVAPIYENLKWLLEVHVY